VRALRVAEVGGRSISAYLTLRQAGKLIFGREYDPAVTDYISMEAMAKCPNCRRGINEKTLVDSRHQGERCPYR